MTSNTNAQTQTADAGKVRIGAGCRLQQSPVASNQTADAGKVRVAAGCRLPNPAKA